MKCWDSAVKHGSFESPITVALLVPQFSLTDLIEAFTTIAMMKLLTTHCLENMKTLSGAIFFLSLSNASYLSSILVNIILKFTELNCELAWLGGNDLNKNRLDYFYFTIFARATLKLHSCIILKVTKLIGKLPHLLISSFLSRSDILILTICILFKIIFR
jgi:hypothetical protein